MSIANAISYCASFDPSLVTQIQGATTEDIEAIAELIGRPVGALHLEFLEHLGGASTGWLRFGNLDVSARAVRRAHQVSYGDLPVGFELFGVSSTEPFEDAYIVQDETIDLMPTRRGGNYATLSHAFRIPFGGSLDELVCRNAVLRYQLDPMPLQRSFGQTGGTASLHALIDEVTVRFGLSLQWFSDGMSRVAVNESTTLIARQAAGRPMSVTLAGNDTDLCDAVSKVLVEDLELLPETPA